MSVLERARQVFERIRTADESPAVARLADLQERIRLAERRAMEVEDEAKVLREETVNEHDVVQALAAFDPVWDTLTPHEQARIIGLLVERVDYDGAKGTVAITFHPSGIKTLTGELAGRQQGRSA